MESIRAVNVPPLRNSRYRRLQRELNDRPAKAHASGMAGKRVFYLMRPFLNTLADRKPRRTMAHIAPVVFHAKWAATGGFEEYIFFAVPAAPFARYAQRAVYRPPLSPSTLASYAEKEKRPPC